MNKLAKKNNIQTHILVMIFVIMSAGIITAGWFYYSNYKTQYKAKTGEQLSAIGKLKVEGLEHWRKDRLGDGKVFYKNAVFSALVDRYFDDPNNADKREQLKAWLISVQTAYQYDKIFLLDSKYHEKIVVPDGPNESESFVLGQTSDILESGQVTFEDFYCNEQEKRIFLRILVPIFKDDGKMIGVVAMRIDPETYLYPYIKNWPLPNITTAETLLVRKKGMSVEFLNELKFQKGTALILKRSVTNKNLPAAKAVLGYEGIVEGVDYRGIPVIADVRAVPDSPWFLVTRMDISEIYAPLKQRLWTIIVFIGVLLAGAGISVSFVWKRRTVSFYRQKYDEAKEWNKTFDAITDMVSIVDMDNRIKTVNKAFADAFGKRPEELIGMRCCELVHNTKEPPEYCPLRKTLATGETAKIEIYYDALRKHLEISTSPVFGDNGEIIETVHFIRDITVRKLMEEGRREADAHLRDAVRFNQEVISNASVGVVVYDTQLRYLEWNAFMENLTGLKKKDLIGRNAIEVFPHLREQGIDKLLARALAGETVPSEDTKYRCDQTGKSGWMVGTYTPHRNSCGQIIGVIGIIRDITEQKQAEERLLAVNALKESLLPLNPIEQKLKFVTDAVVRILDADFARIWVINPGDRCEAGCIHAQAADEQHVCRFRDKCLHLAASSGRYTHIDGTGHCRVPFGCYKIGLIAAGDQEKFLTNEATSDIRIHNRTWAKELGLVSFAGYRLMHSDGTVLGVLALFSKHPISPQEDAVLEGIAHSTSMVIHTSHVEEELHKSTVCIK